VYLNQYHLIPYERVTEIFEDLFGQSISQGTLLNALETSYHNLESTENWIKERILDSNTAHFDETGLYLGGKRVWLHNASTEGFTYYFNHSKRGREAMDDAGILPNYKGVAVHDHWEPYNSYENCAHAFCNVHHLRELIRAYEQDGAYWANEMKELLIEIKEKVDEAKNSGKQALESDMINSYHQRYQNILREAIKTYPSEEEAKDKHKRGRKKRSKSKNLLDRLIKYEKETLRFMEDFEVPFDNSLAERDIRMVKVKQKISGCFRSKDGPNHFCRIRGFISTAKKQGKNILEYLSKTFQISRSGNVSLFEG
jgi:transposase